MYVCTYLLIWLHRVLVEAHGVLCCDSWTSVVAQLVKNPPAMRETWVWSLGWEDPLEKGKVTHSGTLAWRIPWTGSPWGWQRARHDWATRSHLHELSSLASRLSCSVMCRVLVPQPGIEPASPALQGRFLATAPPGEVPCMLFWSPEFLLCVCIMKTFLCRNFYFLIIIVIYYFPIFIPLIYLSFILSLTGIATKILNSSSQNSHSYPLTIFNIFTIIKLFILFSYDWKTSLLHF